MNLASRIALLGTFALLAACGGGGGGDVAGGAPPPVPADPPGNPPVTGALLTGVVAVGAPLAGATVDSLCGNGDAGPGTTTDAQGKYEMRMPEACPTPWLLRASGGGQELFSFGGEKPVAGVPPVLPSHINITPLTTLFVERVTFETIVVRGLGDLREAGETWRTFDPALFEGRLQELLDRVNQWRSAGMPALELVEILGKPFEPKPGDIMDDFLERIKAMQGNVDTSALLEQAMQRGGNLADGTPWKTLFRNGDTLTLSATNCPVLGAPAVPATVTLRMDGQNLNVDVATESMAPFSFTTGPATTRGEFQMILRGSSPYVRMMAGARVGTSTRRIELFVQEGQPMISLTSGSTTKTCALDTPLRRAELVAFHPAARVLSALPADGATGSCVAVGSAPAYSYAVTPMGDIRFDGTSLPANWLGGEHGYYSESLQYNMFGSTKAFQVQVSASATQQGFQPYVFTGGQGVNCTNFNF